VRAGISLVAELVPASTVKICSERPLRPGMWTRSLSNDSVIWDMSRCTDVTDPRFVVWTYKAAANWVLEYVQGEKVETQSPKYQHLERLYVSGPQLWGFSGEIYCWLLQWQNITVISTKQVVGHYGRSHYVTDTRSIYLSSLFPAMSWCLLYDKLTINPFYVDIVGFFSSLCCYRYVNGSLGPLNAILFCRWLIIYFCGFENVKSCVTYSIILVILLLLYFYKLPLNSLKVKLGKEVHLQ
jgi:hypothetical protein